MMSLLREPRVRKRILPSGDQLKARIAPLGKLVICLIVPLGTGCRQTFVAPPRDRQKSTPLPSGDQCGIPSRTLVRVINGWVTSASKAAHCCVSCWLKQHKQRPVVMRSGDDGMYTWRCVGKKVLPRWPWREDSQFGCTGCGETVGSMRSGSNSVRTRDSS
jgi:hypothetical protein